MYKTKRLQCWTETTADAWLCHVMMVKARPKVVLSISTCDLNVYLFQVKNIYFYNAKKNIQLFEMFELYILTSTAFLNRIYWWVFNNFYVVVSCRNKYGEKLSFNFCKAAIIESSKYTFWYFYSFCSENSYHCKQTCDNFSASAEIRWSRLYLKLKNDALHPI